MSFRRRLTLFFLAIVGLPMIAVAVLVVQVTEDSRDGKADARLDSGLNTARTVYDKALRDAPDAAGRVATKAGPALQRGDREELMRILRKAVGGPGVVYVKVTDPSGEVLASAGPSSALGVGKSDVRLPGGRTIATIQVGTLTPENVLENVSKLTGRDVAIVTDDGLLGSTRDLGDADLPKAGDGGVDLELTDETLRAAALSLNGAPEGARLVLLTPREAGFVASEPLVAVILGIFFAVAFVLIALLLRNLQRRVAAMLQAARRIGDGDFTGKVPVEGNDEMAGLAREFNKMSERLSAQMGELNRQQEELDESVQRIGEAFASGLDRRALLEIVNETAATACSAEAGRVVLNEGPDGPQVLMTQGSPAALGGVLEEAGSTAAANRGSGDACDGDLHAMATAIMDRRDADSVLCTIAVARQGQPFEPREREVLRYLLRQAVVSIENIGLHERVAEQAVTDDLTGIPNHRHFNGWIEQELARIERFGGELSLVLVDIDNFKEVNDTYGHLLGDRVLEEMGRLLRIESRGIDLAARYGGEEFVLALPETSLDGAVEVAERLRRRIERTRVPTDVEGPPIEVTASLGVANLPADAGEIRSLISAADEALYDAKRAGKNQVSRADSIVTGSSQGKRIKRRS